MSSTHLQAAHDAVQAHMPELQFCMLPKAVAASLATIANADAAAAAVADAARAAVSECQVCGAQQQQQLALTLSTRLDVRAKVVHVTGARFACAACAALLRPGLLLELATPRPGASAGSDKDDRAQHLEQLFLHLAGVNGAAAEVTSNPEALAVWVQELACRAASVSVTASSLGRWRLQPAHSSPAQLLRGLLLQQDAGAAAGAAASPGKKKSKAAAVKQHAAPAAVGSSGKKKRPGKEGVQQQENGSAEHDGRKKKKKQQHAVSGGLAALPAGFQTPQQGKSAKQRSTTGAAARVCSAVKKQAY